MTDFGEVSPHPHEVQPSKEQPLAAFAQNIRSILGSYRNNVCSKVNHDGIFVDAAAEQESVENWDKWQHIPTLPKFTDREKPIWISEVEAKLNEITRDPTQQLTFADQGTLVEYYKTRYPQYAVKIADIFESFDHDINLVSSGIDSAFSDEEKERTSNALFRRHSILQWQDDLLELTAEELEKQYPIEEYDFVENLIDLQTLFQAVDPAKYSVTIDKNDPQHIGFLTKGSRLKIKQAVYNILRNVQKRTAAKHSSSEFCSRSKI